MAGTESGKTENAPSSWDGASIAQVREAAKRLRDTATWTLGAIAAIGTTAGGALSFAGIIDLELGSWRFWVAAAGLALVVLAATASVRWVATVLAPAETSLANVDTKGFTDDMLFGHGSMSEFVVATSNSEKALIAANTTAEIAAKKRIAELYRDRAERIAQIGLFFMLSTFAVHSPAAAQACWTCVISAAVGAWPAPG